MLGVSMGKYYNILEHPTICLKRSWTCNGLLCFHVQKLGNDNKILQISQHTSGRTAPQIPKQTRIKTLKTPLWNVLTALFFCFFWLAERLHRLETPVLVWIRRSLSSSWRIDEEALSLKRCSSFTNEHPSGCDPWFFMIHFPWSCPNLNKLTWPSSANLETVSVAALMFFLPCSVFFLGRSKPQQQQPMKNTRNTMHNGILNMIMTSFQ